MTETKSFSLNALTDRIVKQMRLALECAKATDYYSRYDKLQKDLYAVNNKVKDKEIDNRLDIPSPQKS